MTQDKTTASSELRFDVRVQPHLLRRQQLTREELAAHLASLPDEADEVEPSEVRFVASAQAKHT